MSQRRASLPAYPSFTFSVLSMLLVGLLAALLAVLVVWTLGLTNTDQFLLIHLAWGRALRVEAHALAAGYLACLALGALLGWQLWHRRFVRRMRQELQELRAARDRLRLAQQALQMAADALAPLSWGPIQAEEEPS